MTEVASSKCPLCGISTPHEHSGIERAIYRNGQKSALAMLNNPIAYWAPHADMVITSARRQTEIDRRLNQGRDSNFYIPLYEKPVLAGEKDV